MSHHYEENTEPDLTSSPYQSRPDTIHDHYQPEGLKIKPEDALKEDSKHTNPKDAIGSDKIPLHLWPETASILGSLAFLEGALKYGRSNYRAIGVRASIYHDACRRHLIKWFEGEDNDEESGLPHLSHALACIAIIVDAQANGKLNDDRMIKGGTLETLKEMTPHVKRLKDKYKDRSPYHYTKKDSQ